MSATGSLVSLDNGISLDAAAELIRIDGKPVDRVTVWRWARRGIRGVYLDHKRRGRKIVTSAPAIEDFMTRLAEAADDLPPPPAPCRAQSQRRRDQAEHEADALGL